MSNDEHKWLRRYEAFVLASQSPTRHAFMQVATGFLISALTVRFHSLWLFLVLGALCLLTLFLWHLLLELLPFSESFRSRIARWQGLGKRYPSYKIRELLWLGIGFGIFTFAFASQREIDLRTPAVMWTLMGLVAAIVWSLKGIDENSHNAA
jgi:ABC-type Mn2+/Zn2+ transport system permease subunit